MRSDVYRLMTLAVACNLSCDEAYEMLQQSYIDKFASAYERLPDGAEKPSVLDALISYTIQELPILTGIDVNILYEMQSKRADIVNTFVMQDLPSMVTILARRTIVLEEIRKFLRKENTMNSMYAMLNSTRVDSVFVLFLEVFQENCAHAFQFDGSFIRFVMNCFQEYFYKGRKTDIWAMIREADLTKREVEQSVVEEKILEVKRSDDLLIHDLLINISLVNDLLFKHAGQSEDAYGVQYDIYYLILCELCKSEVERINSALGYEALVFVDPLDRRDGSVGRVYNKGIGSKISNAQAMIPYIFGYVRDGKLNVSNLSDLRDKCFTLGKADNEGRNCIWKDVVEGGETSRYLDTRAASDNYARFDQVLKGVISVYTLMTEVEHRGISLVSSYNVDLFQDKNLIRYMDYLSSVQYIDLIRQLQQEPTDLRRYSDELFEFDKMLDAYAGSSVNNHTNIRENRYYAITHGFLVKPKIKQSAIPVSQFEVLRSVADLIEATPHGYREYLASKDVYWGQQHQFDTWMPVEAWDVVAGKYQSLYYNVFMTSNTERAKYYLLGQDDTPVDELLDSMEWHVGTARYEAIEFAGKFGVYVPLERGFFFYDFDNRADPFTATLEDVYGSWNGHRELPLVRICAQLKAGGILKEFATQLGRSVGFPWEIGLSNLNQSDVQSRLEQSGLVGPMRKYVQLYYKWVDENAKIEHSLMDVLRVMFAQVVYFTSGAHQIPADRAHDVEECKKLRDGLLTGEFQSDSLSSILTRMRNAARLETVDWSVDGFHYKDLDRSCLDYVFDIVPEPVLGKRGQVIQEPYTGLVKALDGVTGVAERFTVMYNYVYAKLEFLRYIRDSLSLIVSSTPHDSATLVCELNQRFAVGRTLSGFAQANVGYGIRVETQDYAHIKTSIVSYREECLRYFRTLIGEFTKYLQECEDEIAKLVSYSVVSQDVVTSRFAEFDRAFKLLPRYDGVPELDVLRQRATCDGAGFFLMNGAYFKCRNSTRDYYVHRSGHMVYESAAGFQHVDFDLSSEDDRRLYSDILKRGLENAG